MNKIQYAPEHAFILHDVSNAEFSYRETVLSTFLFLNMFYIIKKSSKTKFVIWIKIENNVPLIDLDRFWPMMYDITFT